MANGKWQMDRETSPPPFTIYHFPSLRRPFERDRNRGADDGPGPRRGGGGDAADAGPAVLGRADDALHPADHPDVRLHVPQQEGPGEEAAGPDRLAEEGRRGADDR